MTEAEWLSCGDPLAMLAHLGEHAGWYRRQLYCLACWDRVRPLLVDDCRRSLAYLESNNTFDWSDPDIDDFEIVDIDSELTNRFWGGLVAGDQELWDRVKAGTEASLTDFDDPDALEAGATFVVTAEALDHGWVRSLTGMQHPLTASMLTARIESSARAAGERPLALWRSRLRSLADLVREVFGVPFHSKTTDPNWLAWNGGTVKAIAEAIDEEQAFDRLPILGDALEDAGCTDDTLLSHLRSPGPHVRGCWALDLLLGRS